jgi:hypothetical protein
MILVNSETKKPCNCSDCIKTMELKKKLQNASWTRNSKLIAVDSIRRPQLEPWYNRI